MKQAVLITGAAQRLGRGIALHLARYGYDIALHYHRAAEAAEQAQAEIRETGAACELFQADFADAEALSPLAQRVRDAFPHCRHLVNNASLFERGTLMQSGPDAFTRHMQVNVMAPVFLTKAFALAFPGEALSVVNLLDTKMQANRHSYFFYLLSKKALRDCTRMAAAELGPRVRVNGVAPGMVLAGAEPFGEEYRLRLAGRLPLKRAPEPEDVAAAV
ncbi:MAG: SDR family oxidoreductase, partial [Alphaproteobacteria bacterium]|nr:SDR family oxidoreductase [Alphaproteobacteria bacterium]